MQNFFDIIAPIYEQLRPDGRRVFDKLTSLVDFSASDHVVDIGGGTGAIAKFFVGHVKMIEVIDPSPKMIARCRRHAGISCILGGGENLPLADKSVDKIILVDAFHHIPDQKKTVKEMKRVLKEEGIVIIGEYHPEVFGGKLIVFFENLLCLGSIFHTPTQLSNLFSQDGFAVQIFHEGKKDYYLIAKNI